MIITSLKSPSLRGSGLKYWFDQNYMFYRLRLPLYEGVDWNMRLITANHNWICLPLYEGVDWNSYFDLFPHTEKRLPLYEGVDWNVVAVKQGIQRHSLPLYEGVDWNRLCVLPLLCCVGSPSLRGSGLKFHPPWMFALAISGLPLYEGVDWNHRLCNIDTV